jgi:hypothetical protein
MDSHLPQLAALIETRLLLVRNLADSLEASRSALLSNDAEAIARGAAHQAELCRQWGRLEDQIRQEREQQRRLTGRSAEEPPDAARLTQLEDDWTELSARIRRLTRVHLSLLRHLNRSLAVLARVVESCAPTYTPGTGMLPIDTASQAGG